MFTYVYMQKLALLQLLPTVPTWFRSNLQGCNTYQVARFQGFDPNIRRSLASKELEYSPKSCRIKSEQKNMCWPKFWDMTLETWNNYITTYYIMEQKQEWTFDGRVICASSHILCLHPKRMKSHLKVSAFSVSLIPQAVGRFSITSSHSMWWLKVPQNHHCSGQNMDMNESFDQIPQWVRAMFTYIVSYWSFLCKIWGQLCANYYFTALRKHLLETLCNHFPQRFGKPRK